MNFTSDSEPPTEIQLGFSFPEPSPLIHDTSITFRLESPYKAPIPPTSSTVEEEHSEQLRRDLDRFYKENKQKIENSLDVGSQEKESKGADVDSAIDVFLQTASVVLEGLTALGNIHPVIGVAIFAFQGVIKLDLARRDNDKKVLAVILQMQNMMSALFQLRELRGVHLHETSKDQEKGALQRLIEVVAQNITSCRSDLAYYTKRKFISKLISAKNYEQLFADHIQIFVLRRSELQTAIATYTALGVDAANMAIIEVGNKLESMDKKFETMILAIFRKLDTPRERDIFKFLDKNGGAQKKLLSDSGESLATGKTGQDDFATLQTSLKDELSADLKQILEKNQARFERLLNVQNNNMKRISDQMEDQGQVMYDHTTKLGEILNKVTTVMVYEEGRFRKKEVKLKDPEIQQVWERMGLDRRSVKATHFVLTFRDHILMGYSTPSTPQPRRPTDLNDDQPSVLLFSTAPAPSSDKVLLPAQEDPETETNQWMLEYIDAAYVQPIIEAIDDDGSGFISVQEASKFALARPKELRYNYHSDNYSSANFQDIIHSLLHWMAYWAAGWHINITNYRWNIYSVLLEMHDALPSIHLANRSYIDEYLSEIPFRRVEAVLRSIRPLPDSADKESKLSEMANSIANAELQRLLANLNEMSFILESSLDVNAVGGTERVETWILPLLYLVLKHHLAIMKLAQKLVLDPVELSTHTTSLRSIFLVFDDRMHNLEAKFRQVHRDVDARFESFAYGMFFTSFKKKEYAPSENTTMTSRERQYLCHPLAISEAEEITDSSILAKPPGENFEFDEGEYGVQRPIYPEQEIIQGHWTDPEDPKPEDVVADNANNDGSEETDEEDVGSWDDETASQEIPDAEQRSYGAFYIRRTPPDVIRFRHLLDGPGPDSEPSWNSWTVARKRWAFASAAILYRTRDRMGSSRFFRERIAERRKWTELSVRFDLADRMSYYSFHRSFSDAAYAEWVALIQNVHPRNARIFQSLSNYWCQRNIYQIDEVRPIKSEYDQLERQLEDMETRLNQEIMEGLSSLQKEIISQWKRPGITKNGAQKSMKGSEMKDDEVNSLVIDHGVKEVAETFSDIDSDISEEPGSAAEVDANATERLASKDEGMTAVKSRLEEGLKALELKVEEIGKRGQNMSQEDRISALEAKVDERLNALEARVENQFGVMLSLLQELVATTRPLTIGTEA
ncbi:hypothetical protein BDZ97DRAFT_1917696 [Flammula alnicola]|nr:hypothetical protein BDZ97DRAFT_1917696 [Flammula alnicola]